MQANLKIGFIGGGNMASALIGGLAGKLTAGANIHVVDPNADALQKLQANFGVTTGQQIDDALATCNVIVLSVKPQQMKDVVQQLRRMCPASSCCRLPPASARWTCRAGSVGIAPSCGPCPTRRH